MSLEVTAGPCAGRVFTFRGADTFLVGRSTEAHLALPGDTHLSRVHLMIEVNPPLCRVTDLGSKNGTWVNRRRLTAAFLADGDLVEAGSTALRVAIQAPPAGAAPPPAPGRPPSAAPGLVVGGYQLHDVLGRGGMGVVFRAARAADGRAVAVKMVRPAQEADADRLRRFRREIDALVRLGTHPHLVTLIDHGVADGQVFFVMELVEGPDAAALVGRGGPLPVGRAVRLARQLLAALGHAHDAGLVHRDVKPSNLLVGPGDVLKLADFGLAKAFADSALSGLTLSGMAGGTPAFLPPEQATDFREARPPADQYAAAASLVYLLTGEPLFPAALTTGDLVRLTLEEQPPPLERRRPGVPPGLAAAVGRALAKQPLRRFPGVAAFAAALAPFEGVGP